MRTADDWQMGGSCRRLAPEVFYPEDGGRRGLHAREEQAKQICRTCPVVSDCRNHALSVRETYGVWGAMSARDRKRELVARAESSG
jgi:WhiB family redox-sensing transcriptional regulator